jgi:hypothetical protein
MVVHDCNLSSTGEAKDYEFKISLSYIVRPCLKNKVSGMVLYDITF